MIENIPVIVPELGTRQQKLRVTAWFVEPGQRVDVDEPLCEVLLPGITFAVPAPVDGVLQQVVSPVDTSVLVGDVLGWITPFPPLELS